MADDLLAISAASIASSGRQVLSAAVRPARTTTVLNPGQASRTGTTVGRAPSSATQGTDGRAPADINIADARSMIRSALVAAERILRSLDGLSDTVGLSAESSLDATFLNVQPNGTRISGVNIQAAASRTAEGIDRLVDSIGIGGVNLLSGSSRALRVQTTQFGGQLTIAPQPLDSRSLGIDDLSTIDRDDAQAALGAVERARAAVISRISTLEALERSLDLGGSIDRGVSRVVSGGDGLSGRGALVDISV